jgi:yecA family protein
MIDPFKDPDKAQLKQLNDFLTDIYEDAEPLSITQVHGFLCAIATAPCTIMPSKYQPVLFGGNSEFQSIQQVKNILGIITALANSINSELKTEAPFVPLLWDNNDIVDYHAASLELIGKWCDGYIIATKLDPKWSKDQRGFV